MWNSLSLWNRVLSILIYYLHGKKHATRFTLQNHAAATKGLAGLYQNILMHCGHELASCFKLLNDPDAYPIIIHCSAGKDRTGVTIALILLLLGVSDQEIVNDYARTAKELESESGNIVKEAGKMGLSKDFAECPPQAMIEMILFLNQKYGSVNKYLESIGIDASMQSSIRSRLLVPSPKL